MTEIATLQVKIESKKAELNALQKDLKNLSKGAQKAESAFGGIAGKLKLVGAAVTTAAIYKATKQWIEFSAALSDLSAITGATGKDLEYLKDQSLAIGAATTLSATQAAIAFKLIASAKPDLLESSEALAAVTRETVALSEAAGVDLVTAANAVGSALNQFSAGAEQASRFVNVLAAGAKFGASEVNDTAQALRLAGVVAANASLSFEDTNTSIQLLAKGAIKGSEAGTGLRGVILKLSTQANDDFNPALVGMEQALKNLAAAELTATEKKKLFGQESITTAELLIKEADNFGKLKEQISATGTAYDQARVRNNNLKGDLARLSSITESAGIQFGEVFDPALRAVVQSASFVIKAIKSVILTIDDVGNAIGAYAAASASFLSGEFAQAGQILDLRKAERTANEKKFESIWAIANAETEAAEQVKKVKESETARQEEELALAERRKVTATQNAQLLVEQEAIKAEKIIATQVQRGADELVLLETQLLSKEERLQISFDNRLLILDNALLNDQLSNERHNELTLQLTKQNEDQKTEIINSASNARRQIAQRSLGAIAGIFDGLTALMTKSGKKQTAATRIIAKASIIASTAQAVMNALAVPPYPLGVALAVGAGLKGAAQLKAVGGGGGITVPSVSSGNTSPISAPPNADAYGPQSEPAAVGPAAPRIQVLDLRLSGDNIHSEAMREFAITFSETIKDMGGVDLVRVS